MKLALGVVVILIVAGLGWFFFIQGPSESATVENQGAAVGAVGEKSAVTAGSYEVDAAASSVAWAAKKPLIEGYVNSGSIGVASGNITASESSATGTFTLDMNKLTVGLTATKPGKEGALESHLKTDDFFDVTKYPTATFEIVEVTPTATSASDFTYTVRGKLTMKDKTNEITFPAMIYLVDGKLHADASFKIDRTKWGLTYGSGNFFQSLGNNLIADEVALTLKLIASPKAAN